MPFDGSEFSQGLAVEKIDRVIRLLAREDQWCKGVMRSSDGRRCLAGAVFDADARSLLAPVLLEAIHEITGKKHWRIEVFNDAPSTTHAQILRVLYRARENTLHGHLKAPTTSERIRMAWKGFLHKLAP